MKNIFFLVLLFGAFAITSCGDDDSDDPMLPDYSVEIMSPDNAAKHVDDDIHIHVNFKEKNGNTIHHINVRIYNKADGTEIYNKPEGMEKHIHDEDGDYEYHHNFNLAAGMVDGHTDWILEAKVWGHDEGVSEKVATLGFHVHP